MLGGARYTKHEYEFDLEIGSSQLTNSVDQDWTDALVGLTHGYQISDKWTWTNRADVGFGGSESTLFFNSSCN